MPKINLSVPYLIHIHWGPQVWFIVTTDALKYNPES